MTTGNDAQRLQELEEVLDIYGADRSRWPVEKRHALAEFVAGNAMAGAMIEEAVRLDRLISGAKLEDDVAATGVVAKTLAAGIVEGLGRDAGANTQEGRRTGPAQGKPASSRSGSARRFSTGVHRRPTPRRTRVGAEIAAMAAALLLLFGTGVYAGFSGWLPTAGDEYAEIDGALTDGLTPDPLFDEDII